MSFILTRSGRKISRNTADFKNLDKKDKKSKKKLILFDEPSNTNTSITDEFIFKEICNLSPLSPIKKSKENIAPSFINSHTLTSPLRGLTLNSPTSKQSIHSPRKNCMYQSSASPKKRVLNEYDQSLLDTLSPTQKKVLNVVECLSKSNLPPESMHSPSKKSKILHETTSENTSPRNNTCSAESTNIELKKKFSVAKNIDLGKKARKISKKLVLENDYVGKRDKDKQSKLQELNHELSKQQSELSAIKNSLHNSIPDFLIGRDCEIEKIKTFINDHAKTRKSASLYISGAPGTGKTACIFCIMEDSTISKDLECCVTVNCMALQNSQTVYQRVADQLGATSYEKKSVNHAQNFIEKKLTQTGRMILLVLDEMDQLDSKNQEVLYVVFGWTSLKNSRLILIGIANSLNLTDRILPRLKSYRRSKPDVLNFKPYSKDELLHILQNRMQQSKTDLDFSDVIDPAALQFCARKVAATTGDARKALDICRRAVEMLEVGTLNRLEKKLPVKVGLMQISKVITSVNQSSNLWLESEKTESEESFPLQQKLVVCSLILLCRNIKCKEAPLGKLYESYIRICKKQQVSSVNQSEFYALCELVESRGLISVKKAKQLRLSQVRLNIQESDVEYAMKGKALLSSILENKL